MALPILTLLLPWLAAGCATMAGRTQVIAIDSEPRAVDVFVRGGGRPVGRTPVFIEVSRGRSLDLLFGSGPERSVADQTCAVRWKGFGISSAILLVLSPPLGLVSTGADLLDGAAFQCDDGYFFPLTVPASGAVCHRYLVVPPHHADEAISDHIALAWIKRQRQELGTCDSIVDYDDGKTTFAYLNYDNEFDLHPAVLDRTQTNALGYATKATDLVFLERADGPGSAVVSPVLVDMFRGDERAQKPIAFTGPLGDEVKKSDETRLLGYSFSLIPNSMIYSFDNTSVDLSPAAGTGLADVHLRDTAPQYITGFSLTDVEHPMGVGSWGFTLHVYPLILPEYWDLAYGRAEPPGAPPVVRKVRVVQLLAQEYGGVTLHTPVGAFEAAAGAGPIYLNEHAEGRRWWDAMALSTSTDLTYTAFVTNRVFLQIRSWTVAFPSQRIGMDGQRLTGYTQSSLGVGYFLPTLRSHIRRALFGSA